MYSVNYLRVSCIHCAPLTLNTFRVYIVRTVIRYGYPRQIFPITFFSPRLPPFQDLIWDHTLFLVVFFLLFPSVLNSSFASVLEHHMEIHMILFYLTIGGINFGHLVKLLYSQVFLL